MFALKIGQLGLIMEKLASLVSPMLAKPVLELS